MRKKHEEDYDDGMEKKPFLSDSQRETLGILGVYMIPVAACFLLFLLSAMIAPKAFGDRTKEIAQQEADMVQLQNELDVLKNQVKSVEGTGGMTADGVFTGRDSWTDDDKVAEAFFSKITTWSDGEYYESLRTELKSAGYDENSSVMQVFLPQQDITVDDERHQVYSVNTKGQNMSFGSLTTYQLSKGGGKASYAGRVRVTSRSTDITGVPTEAQAYVRYDINEGKIENIQAWALEN